jgi:3-methyladenine DNA glycosylase AlkD
MIYKQIEKEIRRLENPIKAEHLKRFFKTGIGQYGEGDVFLGLTVPQQRNIVKQFYKETTLSDISELIISPIHEVRLTSLLILVEQYQQTKNEDAKKEIVGFYLKYPDYINNWDLVDLTAYKILGDFLLKNSDREILYNWSRQEHLWKQRISIISTFAFIRAGEFKETFDISDILLNHKHDLIHKAVGWMLREIGKRDIEAEIEFLKSRYLKMPRTMLRYAIEKFLEEERQLWLKGKISL